MKSNINFFVFLMKKNFDKSMITIVYFLLTSIFVILLGTTIGKIHFERICQKTFLSPQNLYTFIPYSELGDNLSQNRFNQLINMEEIDCFNGAFFLDDAEGPQSTPIISCSPKMVNNVSFDLKSGNGFSEQPNEIIVLNNLSNYSVGDQIVINSDNESIKCKVVGVMNFPVFMENTSEVYAEREEDDDLDGSPTLMFWFNNYLTSKQDVFILNPTNKLISTCEQKREYCYSFVRDNKKENSKVVLDELKKYGDLENVQQLIHQENSYSNHKEIVIEICFLILFFCGLIINNYLNFIKIKKEYGIFYLLGLSWDKGILLALFRNFIAFPLGIITGIIVEQYLNSRGYFEICFSIKDGIFLTLIVLGIYFTSMLPILFKLLKDTPISLLKEGEGVC